MLEVGSLVDGKYKVLAKIGQGGMSVVYLALNERANKQWAIKEVRKDGLENSEVVRQGLIVETEMLKRMRHPHLPSIVDVIDHDDSFLIVMDYIQGNPLDDAIAEAGAQPQELVVNWAKQLCDVLGYLHSQKPPIIYRDMKPSNVMLQPDGNVTLIDFGAAREFKERNVADTTLLGTRGYAAPEQYGGKGQTDARTDIYCLGATLYHLVTGLDPSAPPYEMLPIRSVNPLLSSGLEQVILKCTNSDPNDRYQSCPELMYDLEHLDAVDGEYRVAQKRKFATFVGALAASLVCLIVGIASLGMQAGVANADYDHNMELARRAATESEAVDYYSRALLAKPDAIDAYRGLIKVFQDGGVFTLEEQAILKQKVDLGRGSLSNNPQYPELLFEIGRAYWYFSDYGRGNGQDNSLTRMKSALPWFQDAVERSTPESAFYQEARIYSNIGSFYSDITLNVEAASDKGMYLPYWENIKELTVTVDSEKNESELVELEVYRLALYSIETYAKKFRADGVTRLDLEGVAATAQNAVASLDAVSDKGLLLKAQLVEHFEAVREAIERAFPVGK
jgi:serine/threonine-protein kinase